MRGGKREHGEWEDRDDFLFRQTHCGSFIIFPRQLPRPPALSLPSLFPSPSVSIFLSVFHLISVCHSLYCFFTIPVWSLQGLPTLFPCSPHVSVSLPALSLSSCSFCVYACLMWGGKADRLVCACVCVHVCDVGPVLMSSALHLAGCQVWASCCFTCLNCLNSLDDFTG